MAWPTNTPPPGSYGDFQILGSSEAAELFPNLVAGGSAIMNRNGYYYELTDNPSQGQAFNIARVLSDPNANRYTPSGVPMIYVGPDPYAVPTPLQDGSGIFTPGAGDGHITGSMDGSAFAHDLEAPSDDVPIDQVSSGVPWGMLIAAAVIIALIAGHHQR